MAKKGKLTKQETRQKGTMNWKYVRIMMSYYGRFKYAFYLFIGCLFMGLRMFGDYWIGWWSRDEFEWSRGDYCWIYAGLNLLLLICVLLMTTVHSVGMTNVSVQFNNRMTEGVMRNKIEYFDVTPIGVILNRFTKDVDIMDTNLMRVIAAFQFNLLQILGIFILMIATVPVMIVFVCIAGVVFVKMSRQLLTVSSDIRRMSLVAGSPILSNVSEALQGALVVRVFGIFENMRLTFLRNLQRLSTIELHERVVQCYIF